MTPCVIMIVGGGTSHLSDSFCYQTKLSSADGIDFLGSLRITVKEFFAGLVVLG